MKFDHIYADPEILGGKPCIKGTRISVEIILEWIASGASIADINTKYPQLSTEALREAVLFAASLSKNEILIAVKAAA